MDRRPPANTFWKRAVARTESRDFLKWSTPQVVMVPDEHDGENPAAYGARRGVQLHGVAVFVHERIYFGLLGLATMRPNRFAGIRPIEESGT